MRAPMLGKSRRRSRRDSPTAIRGRSWRQATRCQARACLDLTMPVPPEYVAKQRVSGLAGHSA
jgi:hypothetical protein